MAIPLPDLSAKLASYRTAPRWWVAYSGGVDSRVLLELLAALPESPPLTAVHINHQLQSAANEWEQHCREQAEALGVGFLSRRVAVGADGGNGIEEAARKARYAVFESLLGPGDVLMMGHHLDDQVETLLLRLLRGSGAQGLASIPAERPLGKGVLVRPLLDISREEIERIARERHWQWVDDPSNQSDIFDRNYLRQQVLPLIARRWPGYRGTLARAIALSDESARLNLELAEMDCHALALSPLAESLPIPALRELSRGRLKNVLRFWLQSRQLSLPSATQMDALLEEVINARPDADPLLEWPGAQVRRFRDELYAMTPLPPFDSSACLKLEAGKPLPIDGVGEVSLVATRRGGVSLARVESRDVEIRFRQGGERCRPRGRPGSQTLKKLMQEYAVETWLRDRVPLLYIDGTLAAVADYWVCEGFAAGAGEEGYQCQWLRAF